MADWVAAIADARRQGIDLTTEMSESDWAEYRAQCRAWLQTDAGQAHKQRALDRVAAIESNLREAS